MHNKTITLIRHADAGDRNPQDDHGRRLSAKGIIQAQYIPHILSSNNFAINYILSSDAQRTTQTAQYISDRSGKKIYSTHDLYLCDISKYFGHISEIDDSIDHICIVGHNHEITNFVSKILDCNFPSMSKGSIAIISVNISNRSDISLQTTKHKLLFYHK